MDNGQSEFRETKDSIDRKKGALFNDNCPFSIVNYPLSQRFTAEYWIRRFFNLPVSVLLVAIGCFSP